MGVRYTSPLGRVVEADTHADAEAIIWGIGVDPSGWTVELTEIDLDAAGGQLHRWVAISIPEIYRQRGRWAVLTE